MMTETITKESFGVFGSRPGAVCRDELESENTVFGKAQIMRWKQVFDLI